MATTAQSMFDSFAPRQLRLHALWVLGVALLAGCTFDALFSRPSSANAVRSRIVFCIAALALAALPLLVRRWNTILFYSFVLLCPVEIGKSWFYVPFAYSGIGHELRINVPILLLGIFALVMILTTVVHKRDIYLFAHATIPALGFMSLSAASIILSPKPMLGIFELVRMLTALFIYLVVANYIVRERPNSVRLIQVTAVSLLIQAGVALAQHVHGTLGLERLGEAVLPPTWGEQQISRAGGLMGHPNALGALIILIAPLVALACGFMSRTRLTIVTGCALGAGMMALLLTYSRSAWVGALVGLLLTAPHTLTVLGRSVAPRQRRAALRVALLFASLLILSLGVLRLSLRERLEQSDSGSARSRVDMMIDAVEVIRHNYIIGVGLNNYSVVVPRYDITGIHRAWKATVVHDLYLLIAAESGILSCVLFVWFLWRVLFYARISAEMIAGEKIIILGARTGIICFLILSLTDPAYRFYPGLQRTFWLLLGLITGYAYAFKVPNRGERRTTFQAAFRGYGPPCPAHRDERVVDDTGSRLKTLWPLPASCLRSFRSAIAGIPR